ncbi:MAG: hypothetical protein M3Z15_08305 [Pseudomonadota bacterium]|nr:hypothetical protein [Pseudomonadota bacterium]
MLFTILCCFSTGLAVYCILKRVHRRSVDIAVRLAVREVEKEYQNRNDAMIAQLSAKEGELAKARNLVKLHETVPALARPAPVVPAKKTGVGPPAIPPKKLKQDPLNVFEMSRPFTDTSYDALLASSDVVKVEPAGG